MKAYLNKEEFDKLLGRNPLRYVVEEMNKLGYQIKYKNFYSLYTGKSNWSLVFAFGVANVFNKKIEQLFYVKAND